MSPLRIIILSFLVLHMNLNIVPILSKRALANYGFYRPIILCKDASYLYIMSTE